MAAFNHQCYLPSNVACHYQATEYGAEWCIKGERNTCFFTDECKSRDLFNAIYELCSLKFNLNRAEEQTLIPLCELQKSKRIGHPKCESRVTIASGVAICAWKPEFCNNEIFDGAHCKHCKIIEGVAHV